MNALQIMFSGVSVIINVNSYFIKYVNLKSVERPRASLLLQIMALILINIENFQC